MPRKLSDKQIEELVALRRGGATYEELSTRYGVSFGTAYNYVQRANEEFMRDAILTSHKGTRHISDLFTNVRKVNNIEAVLERAHQYWRDGEYDMAYYSLQRLDESMKIVKERADNIVRLIERWKELKEEG